MCSSGAKLDKSGMSVEDPVLSTKWLFNQDPRGSLEGTLGNMR